MDALISSLKRQYASQPDDQTAHQLVNAILRSEGNQNLSFKEKLQIYNDTVATMNNELGGSIASELQNLIGGDVVAVKWQQYTPYFNDGDTCEFGVYDAYVRFSDTDEEAGDYGDGFITQYDLPGRNWDDQARKYVFTDKESEVQGQKIEEIQTFISSIPDRLMLNAFGDHTEVTIDADGIHTERYDHD